MDRLCGIRGSFCQPNFTDADPAEFESMKSEYLRDVVKILVVGAGGLGCEIVKNLAMMGFVNIHIIDMDTIDPSNLNRQFLFRAPDVGKYKAEVAAAFVNKRCPGAKVVAHCQSVQDKDKEDPDFYRGFMEDQNACIILGLDNLEARKWMCRRMCVLARKLYNEGIVPSEDAHEANRGEFISAHMIDGGTEGFTGKITYTRPGYNACYNCTQVGVAAGRGKKVPICTAASKPRSADHCAVWAMSEDQSVKGGWWQHNELRKSKGLSPEALDKDNPDHIQIITDYAQKHAERFELEGVSFRQVQGVVKNIMPAIGATNAVVAAICCNEAFKYFWKCGRTLQQDIPLKSQWYVRAMGDPESNEPFAPNVFTLGVPRIFGETFARLEDECDACKVIKQRLSLPARTTLRSALKHLADFLRIQPCDYEAQGCFVPKLVLGDCTILSQDFETDSDVNDEDRNRSRINMDKTLLELKFGGKDVLVEHTALAKTCYELVFIHLK